MCPEKIEIWTPQTIAIKYPNILTMGLSIQQCVEKIAARIANTVDPKQTAY